METLAVGHVLNSKKIKFYLVHVLCETVSRQKKWTLIRIRKPLGNGLTKNAGWIPDIGIVPSWGYYITPTSSEEGMKDSRKARHPRLRKKDKSIQYLFKGGKLGCCKG